MAEKEAISLPVWGIIRGVNLGDLVRPYTVICPALFELYVKGTPPAKDGWTAIAADTANAGLEKLENHCQFYITEEGAIEYTTHPVVLTRRVQHMSPSGTKIRQVAGKSL